jgi:alanine racemase
MSARSPDPPAAIGPAEAEAGGVLTIDLAAIVANWRLLGARAAPAECAAVVKADAYGCGIEPVVNALAAAGCRTFFVAHIEEGRRVRRTAPKADVYLLNGLLPGTAPAIAEAGLRPVLGNLEEVREWEAFTAATGWTGGAALHVDTGMNRLGLSIDEARALNQLPRGLSLLMSHLACADEADHPLTARQVSAFRALRARFPGLPGSLANSSGVFLGAEAHHDLVRPGVALYGSNPTPHLPNPMRPVVRLDGRIAQVREVPAGETVGYGASWTAPRPSRVAVISVGYADGVLRAGSPRDGLPGAEVLVAGRRCRLAGRISMDLMAIDVTDVPGVERGDQVTLLGDGIGVDDYAAHAGTIGYEVLTSLGRRYRRTYI